MASLGTFGTLAAGLLLAGLAAPSRAETQQDSARASGASPQASTAGEDARAVRVRRVELPFLLDVPSPAGLARPAAPQGRAGPHPFRDTLDTHKNARV